MRAWSRLDVEELLDRPTRRIILDATQIETAPELLDRPARRGDTVERERPRPVEQSACVSVGPLAQFLRLPAWRRYASCRGQGRLFYAGDAVSTAIALQVCKGCGVLEQCRADALADEYDSYQPCGVRGGLTPGERRARIER